ncbi:hypothetical protein HPB50_026430 [Hyalomma asiaticum]|uniref:Uncharacterized protein n=1 Tax=Hyalomma asiaticum TaxID=266040 RepID=A0ACB7S9K6_HYAAI|nr:hypothetical protein HPB50_026430 [Hyalomma asiaticum]
MGASGGGRRRLLVLCLLSCVALSAAAEHRTGSKARRLAAGPSPPLRGRRGIRWHKMLEPGRNDDVDYAVDSDDDVDDGQDAYPVPAPRVLHANQEDWLLDNLLSQVRRQQAADTTDEHNQPAELASYRSWVPKVWPERGEASGTTQEREDAAASKADGNPVISAVTQSSRMIPTVDRTSKTKPTTPLKDADDDVGHCPAQKVIPEPQRTTDTKAGGLMAAIFGTKLTSVMNATTKATKDAVSATKDQFTTKASTKQPTEKKNHPTTAHSTQQANNETTRKRPESASAVQAPPKSDIGRFVINRFARVSRESAYMEHMEPMVAFACRVHLWIIGVLCALVILLSVALCGANKPGVEPMVMPARPETPSLSPPLSPASPSIKRPPTEVWEDDLYDVSAISKMEKRPSTT